MRILFFLILMIMEAWTKPSFTIVSTTTQPLKKNDLPQCLTKTDFLKEFHTKKVEIINEIKQDKNYRIILPPDCKEVQRRGYKASGLYQIKPSSKEFWVWCDLATQGGGWTYVANRFDGSQTFYYNWTEYKSGFGNLSEQFWIGLDHLYDLTNSKSTELLFELVDWDLQKVFAKYDKFLIGNEEESFAIKIIGNYSGDAGDSFSSHIGMKFSTADRDQDTDKTGNCAARNQAGWWFLDCFFSLITGIYKKGALSANEMNTGIQWQTFHGYNYSLKQARMMIRPSDV